MGVPERSELVQTQCRRPMRHSMRRSLPLLWASLFAALPLAAARAGDSGSAATAAVDATVLPTVTVTARKRDEPLQEVPESVAVVSGAAIDRRGLDTIGALDSQVANLQISDVSGVRTIFMRGAGGGGRTVGFDPRTGVYVDGVYIGFPP